MQGNDAQNFKIRNITLRNITKRMLSPNRLGQGSVERDQSSWDGPRPS